MYKNVIGVVETYDVDKVNAYIMSGDYKLLEVASGNGKVLYVLGQYLK